MSLTLVQIQIILDTDLHVGQDDSTDYMDSMVLCPLNEKEKESKSDMMGEVPAAPGFCPSAGAAQQSVIPIYTSLQELRSMDSSSMYGCNEPITTPLPNSVPQRAQSWGRATFPSSTVTMLL